MNRSTQLAAVLALAGIMTSGATAHAAGNGLMNADHPAKTKVPKNAAPLQELTLIGTVASDHIFVAGKDRACFVLVTETGSRIHLPQTKAGKKRSSAPAIQLADYLGQSVQVIALGSERKKGDKTVVRVRTLKAIEKVSAPPADAAPAKVA